MTGETKSAGFLILRAGENFRLASGISIEKEMALFSSFHDFLETNGLLRQGFTAPENWSNYEIRSTHLTDEGVAVIRCGLDKWLKALDRGTPPEKASDLKKCLEKIRQADTDK